MLDSTPGRVFDHPVGPQNDFVVGLCANPEDVDANRVIGLIGSLNLLVEKDDIPQLLNVVRDLVKIKKGEDFTIQLAQDMLALSNCPDFVTDRGHEYGSSLSDEEKRALIEFLKQM